MTRLPTLGPRGEGWVVIQGVLLVAVAVAGLLPADAGPWRPLLVAIGGVLVVVGAILAVRGVVDLRESLTPLPHPRDGSALTESGAYRLVRHPIYGGIVIAAVGYSLVTVAPLALAGSVVLLGFFRLKSAREEAWLDERYPGYAAYASRTRRLIPFLY